MATEKRKARITLEGQLTLAVGRFRFIKDRPVTTEDQEVIKYCEFKPEFRVIFLTEEDSKPAPTASQGKGKSKPPQPQGKKTVEPILPAPPAAPLAKEPEKEPEQESLEDEEKKELDDSQLDDLDIDNQTESGEESPGKLTRKP